jgi:DDE superfamily endonuclease
MGFIAHRGFEPLSLRHITFKVQQLKGIRKTVWNYDTKIEKFLIKWFSAFVTFPVRVIADNTRYHHAKKVKTFFETQQGEIMLAFLPAYSAELNPDGQV